MTVKERNETGGFFKSLFCRNYDCPNLVKKGNDPISIHPFLNCFLNFLRCCGEGAGAYSSCIWVRDRVYPWTSCQVIAPPYLCIMWVRYLALGYLGSGGKCQWLVVMAFSFSLFFLRVFIFSEKFFIFSCFNVLFKIAVLHGFEHLYDFIILVYFRGELEVIYITPAL